MAAVSMNPLNQPKVLVTRLKCIECGEGITSQCLKICFAKNVNRNRVLRYIELKGFFTNTGEKLFHCSRNLKAQAQICEAAQPQSSCVTKSKQNLFCEEKCHQKECNVCGKVFTVKCQQSLYSKKQPLKFDICGNCQKNEAFSQEDLNPYKCDVCGKTFTDSVEFQLHIRKYW
eukprot:TCONS_00022012-protein